MTKDIEPAIIGLVGAVIGGLISSLVPWVREGINQSKTRKRMGFYSAIRIIAVLEDYVGQCAAVVSDDGTIHGQPAGRTTDGQEYCVPQVAIPDLPTFPDDVDWQSIGYKSNELMFRVLSLPSMAREANDHIYAAADISTMPDHDELFAARQEGYAYLGLEVVGLVKDLRKAFALPEVPAKPWEWGWDAGQFFQEKLDKIAQYQQVPQNLPTQTVSQGEAE